jgi:hypothetical protein
LGRLWKKAVMVFSKYHPGEAEENNNKNSLKISFQGG